MTLQKTIELEYDDYKESMMSQLLPLIHFLLKMVEGITIQTISLKE